MGRRSRVFFYVQHLLGIGHIVRASRVAEALKHAGFEVTLVTGGSMVQGFPPPGIRQVQLPAVLASNSGFSALADQQGHPVDKAFEVHRAALLLEAFQQAEPDVVIIEAFPFGRRQMRFELLPLLQAVKTAPKRPLLLSSVRDILQENRKAGRDEETIRLVNDHFDGILVHGDAGFVRLEETFPRATEFAGKIHYTGLVAPGEPSPPTERFDVVVSAGGGAVGAQLIGAALEAQQRLGDQRSWCVITGPNLPIDEFDRLNHDTPPNVTIVRFRPDLPALLTGAELSISQAGYNTVCDLLRARCRSVLVPFAAGGETEQTVRAEKLAELGLAEVVVETELTGETLAAAAQRAMAMTLDRAPALSLDGARQTARIISDLINARG
ncbi:glycosyl transferase [Rhizobium deserti]|uniref:Glycosyl transferase n=2 Tax=Rhizobium deserti TaxID=2547961 RepID=A0A4R5UL46_9HYPH|nr:glycosyl transferase [Rhizobium deserti]